MSKKNPKSVPGKLQSSFLKWLDSRQAEWILLGTILILASALRFYNSTSPLMWMDELASIGQSTGQYTGGESQLYPMDVVVNTPRNHSSIKSTLPISTVWNYHATDDIHPPLYHTLLHLWRLVFGDGFLSVRFVSLISSIASVGLIYFLTKSLFDKCAALWASLLMALASPQIIYAQEVRGYALLTLLGLAAVLMLTRIENLGPTILRVTLLGLFSFGLAFTHFFSFGLLLAMAIYTALRLRGKALVYALVGFAFGGFIFLTLWGPQMWNQLFGANINDPLLSPYEYRKNAEIAKQIPELVAGWAERLFFYLPNEFITRPPETLIIYVLPAIAIFWRKNLLLPWLWMLCTMGFVALLDLKRDTFHFTQIRYTLLAAPAVYMVVAAGVFNGKGKTIYNSLLPALLAVFLIIDIPRVYTPCKERWFEIANLIKEKGHTNDIVILPHAGIKAQVFLPRFIWTAISFYIYDPNRPMIIPTKPLTEELISKIGWGKNAWIVTRYPEFQQANSLNWASFWVPGCQVKEGWVAQAGATVFHIKLPEAPSQ